IVEDVFADYAEAGALVPAWRWELADRGVYAKRSLTTQYEESDHAFLQRLLAEEGIFFWFEHAGDASSDTFGTHTLVLADHGDAFGDAGAVRYHRSDATERADSIQQWSSTRRWQTGRLSRASWDYRSLGLRPASAEGETFGGVTPEDSDTAGPYGWHDSAEGERRARQQLEALQVDSRTTDGAGSWRRQAPGTHFELTQHPALRAPQPARLTCLQVRHDARNNLGAEVHTALEQLLGPVARTGADLPEALGGLAPSPVAPAMVSDDGDNDFYRNTFTAVPATLPYRPKTVDGHGLRLHPRPTVHGTQSAIVVSDGAPVQTDRDHRIQVQFAWQQIGRASCRERVWVSEGGRT